MCWKDWGWTIEARYDLYEVAAKNAAAVGGRRSEEAGTAGLGRIDRREIPRLRRPATSQERSRKKKPVCSARNNCWGAGATIMAYFTV